jgi:hypothetical protein
VLWTALALTALLAGVPLAAQQAAAGGQRPSLDELLKRRDPAGLEELKRRFETAGTKVDKQKIAVVLVRRLEDDQPYFDFLAAQARQAVESDMPFPYEIDEQGKATPTYSAAFLSWAARRKVNPDAAAAQAIRDFPMDVYLLALAEDPRSIRILLKGVESPNFMVAYRAAFGLAKLRVNDAVPLIARVAEEAPAQGRELIARTLVLFDSPQAQAAAERLIPDKRVLAALRAQARQELAANIGDS